MPIHELDVRMRGQIERPTVLEEGRPNSGDREAALDYSRDDDHTDPKMIWRVKGSSYAGGAPGSLPVLRFLYSGVIVAVTQSGHSLLPRDSASPDHRQSFRTAPEFEVGSLYGLTIEVHVKRLSRLDREG